MERAETLLHKLRHEIFNLIKGEDFCAITPPPQPPVVQNGGPRIIVINHSTVNFGDIPTLVQALQLFITEHYAPVWGTPATLEIGSASEYGSWALEFWDNADQPGALAYHDLTPEGMPLAKVFVKTDMENGADISVSASHELAEMLVDPMINLSAERVFSNDATIYAYETADAVEGNPFFLINGLKMSNFVYPSWFEDFHLLGSVQFDHLKTLDKPFEISPEGYMPVFVGGQWTTIFGSHEKELRFEQEDRRGHRTEIRRFTRAS